MLVSILSAAILLVNLATMVCFHVDKQRAIHGEWRIREANLLMLSAIGGTPGALLARRLFRHKTRKQPFNDQLLLIGAVQTGVLLSLLF